MAFRIAIVLPLPANAVTLIRFISQREMAAYGHASPLDQELGLKATQYYPMLPQTLSSFEIVPSGLSLEYLTGMTDKRLLGLGPLRSF